MRPGSTRTTSFSLDEPTRKNLKALAARRHAGNVSALIAEMAAREVKLAAAEAFLEKHGIPALSDDAVARIEAEWLGEPSSAAGPRRPAKRQRLLRSRRA
jgi:rubrerythrin